jgi:hypothetical protein
MIVEELLHCQHLGDNHIVLGAGDFGVGQLNCRRPMPIFGFSRPGSIEGDSVVLGALRLITARVAIHGLTTSCYWHMCIAPDTSRQYRGISQVEQCS